MLFKTASSAPSQSAVLCSLRLPHFPGNSSSPLNSHDPQPAKVWRQSKEDLCCAFPEQPDQDQQQVLVLDRQGREGAGSGCPRRLTGQRMRGCLGTVPLSPYMRNLIKPRSTNKMRPYAPALASVRRKPVCLLFHGTTGAEAKGHLIPRGRPLPSSWRQSLAIQ